MTLPPIPTADRYSIYTGQVTNWPMVVLSSVLAVPFVGMTVADGLWWEIALPLALALAGILVNVLTASSVRATAGPNGLTVHWGLIGWPRARYALDDIRLAEVVHVPWWRVSWGFWWTPWRTCCTVQSGPTLRLTLRSGRTVTVTVPEPASAVAALHHATRALDT